MSDLALPLPERSNDSPNDSRHDVALSIPARSNDISLSVAVERMQNPQTSGRLQAFMNFSKCNIGSGLLAAPHVLAEVGMWQGLVLLALVLFCTCYGMNLILKSYVYFTASSSRKVTTVADLTGELVGTGWRRLVEFVTVLMQVCFCVGYVYVILDTGGRVLKISHTIIALVLFPIAIGLGSIKKIRDLWCVSALGLVVFIFGVMIGTLLQALDEYRMPVYPSGDSVKRLSILSWISWLGTFLYGVEAVNHVMPNASSLSHPPDMTKIMVSVFVMYFFLVGSWEALAATYGYGNCRGRNDTVLACLTPGAAADVIQVAVALNLVFTMPITLYPAAQMIEAVFDSRLVQEDASRSMRCLGVFGKIIFRPMFCAVVIALGLIINDLETFTGFVGSTLMIVLGYVVPIRIYVAACALPSAPVRSVRRRVLRNTFHGLLIVLGLCLSIVVTLSKLGVIPTAGSAIKIACVGDSITFGLFSSSSLHSYPSQLQSLLDATHGKHVYSVTNLGESGSTMLKTGDSPYWKRDGYKALTSSKWDFVIVMLGTNDAKDLGSHGANNWQHDCGGAENTTLEGCSFATDYGELINVIKTLGTTLAGPKIYVMIPVPLMKKGAYGMNQTVINSVLPKLLPLIQKDNVGVLGPIDLYSQMGGVTDWQTAFPNSCALDSSFAPCKWWCDKQNCDQCHPNDNGYARIAKLVQVGLGLDQASLSIASVVF